MADLFIDLTSASLGIFTNAEDTMLINMTWQSTISNVDLMKCMKTYHTFLSGNKSLPSESSSWTKVESVETMGFSSAFTCDKDGSPVVLSNC